MFLWAKILAVDSSCQQVEKRITMKLLEKNKILLFSLCSVYWCTNISSRFLQCFNNLLQLSSEEIKNKNKKTDFFIN